MPTATFTIGQFKARLPEALSLVEKGGSVIVTYGRNKRPVAVLAPPPRSAKRKLGHLAGKVRVAIASDWELSDSTFLGA